MRQKANKNQRQVTVQISIVKRTASRKKEEPISKDKNADIQKWFKKKETSILVKGDRKAEKYKTVVVID